MNSEEIAEIKRTWEIPRVNPQESGSAILLCFFNKYPSNIQSFPAFRETPIPELASNARFKRHSTRIIGSFEDSIQALGTEGGEAKIQKIWEAIGDSHVKRHHIERQQYLELREAIVETLTAVCKLNDSEKAAWNKLLDHVYGIIFKKMDELGA